MPTPGDVLTVNLVGAQTTKPRPLVVLSTAVYHARRPDLIVGLLTSQLPKATSPTDYVLLDWAAAGPVMPTAFRSFLSTPAQGQTRVIGRLTPRDWAAVRDRVRLAMDIC